MFRNFPFLALTVMFLSACNSEVTSSKPSPKPQRILGTNLSNSKTLQKSRPFSCQYSWENEGAGRATVEVSLRSSNPSQSIETQLRLSEGMVLLNREPFNKIENPVVGEVYKFSFQVSYPPKADPQMVLEISSKSSTGSKSGQAVLIRDSSRAQPKPSGIPGTPTNIAGYPAKIVGVATPTTQKGTLKRSIPKGQSKEK